MLERPLQERIDNWVYLAGTNIPRILLHPDDAKEAFSLFGNDYELPTGVSVPIEFLGDNYHRERDEKYNNPQKYMI
jgi:hypothetical protein